MKYQKTVDISRYQPEDYSKLQVGQWISQCGARGVYLGTRKYNGKISSIVAAWYDNAIRTKDYSKYLADLRQYAKGE